jgi:hypothetical protein
MRIRYCALGQPVRVGGDAKSAAQRGESPCRASSVRSRHAPLLEIVLLAGVLSQSKFASTRPTKLWTPFISTQSMHSSGDVVIEDILLRLNAAAIILADFLNAVPKTLPQTERSQKRRVSGTIDPAGVSGRCCNRTGRPFAADRAGGT